MHGTVRAVPGFGSDGSSGERVARYFSRVLTDNKETRFRFRFLGNDSGAFWFLLEKIREGPSYGSRRYGSAFFGPIEIWPFSLELSPSISGKIKERTRFVKCQNCRPENRKT